MSRDRILSISGFVDGESPAGGVVEAMEISDSQIRLGHCHHNWHNHLHSRHSFFAKGQCHSPFSQCSSFQKEEIDLNTIAISDTGLPVPRVVIGGVSAL
jgi:hypothetical protein